ncbi:MAG: PorT family protein [Muribaculaceae bacterium]|nr:PorT family protein [Muribaculaceae bacterium]
MKGIFRLITLLCIAAWSSHHVAAQAHYKPHISVGARVGASLAETSFSPSVKQTWLPGECGAVSIRYAEEKLFGLVAELGWSARGWKENFEDTPFSYTRRLTYITLPVMTHISFGGKRALCFINLGPEIGYIVSENISSNFDYMNPAAVSDFPLNGRMTQQLSMKLKNKFDYGITAGLGGEFYLTPRHSITAEARFYYGLANIFPSSKSDVFSASRAMSFEFTLGYFFRLK